MSECPFCHCTKPSSIEHCELLECPMKTTTPIAHMDGLPASERQVGGSHYKDMKIQPVEYIVANGLSFLAGNIVKYVSRYTVKGGVEDLEKAKHYIELLIESERD